MRPIHVPVGVRGRMRWFVLNERGESEAVRVTYADGREALSAGGYWNSNLITNQGMDAFHATSWGWVGLGGAATSSVRRYGRIGTGSTAPAFTDTTLDNQVACSDTASPFANDEFSATEDGGDITLHCMRRVTFVMDVSRNLTEYGFGNTKGGEWVEDTEWDGNPANCSGEVGVLDTSTCMGKVVAGSPEKCWEWNDFNDIYVRELFRDSGGTPITISVPSGRTLRIDHTYDITLDLSLQTGSFDVDEYNVSNALVGTTAVDYHARWYVPRTSPGTATENGRDLAVALVLMARGDSFSGATRRILSSTTVNPDISSGTFLGATPSGYTRNSALAWTGSAWSRRAYVTSSHERVFDITVSAAEGNFAWTGWGPESVDTYDGIGSRTGGFLVAFRNNHTFPKADTHTLRWSIKYAWARG